MKENFTKQSTAVISRNFEIEVGDNGISEEELLQQLADQIAYMIEYRIDFLMSLMYRLDILEHKINAALSPASPLPANLALAHLIIDRQKERIETKKTYKPDPNEDMGDLQF